MKKFKCILLVLLVWLLVFAFVSMVAQVRADPDVWPMFHHDLQHTGSLDSAVSNGVLLWQFSTGDVIRCSPAVVMVSFILVQTTITFTLWMRLRALRFGRLMLAAIWNRLRL